MPDERFVVFFVISFVAVILLGVISQLMFSRLKSRHRAIWESLGSPVVILHHPKEASDFVWRGGYRRLDDDILKLLALIGQAVLVILAISLLILCWLAWFAL